MRLNEMRALSFLFPLTMAFMAVVPSRAADPFDQNQRLGRGVNIIGYDPLWNRREDSRFKERYFQQLKEAGFASVRINLHPFRFMDASKEWALPETWWETLAWVVQEANRQGLSAVLDLHEFGAMGGDPAGNKARFLAFWRQVAPRYKDAPDSVLFEILNEPSRQLTPALWNEYLREALAVIRETNPQRTVIIGPGFWNSIDHLAELQLPENDRNLILTVHYYQPMEFTHQGAAWTNQKDKTGIPWVGTVAERLKVMRDFARVSTWAKAHNRPVYLGEFGAYDRAPMDSRARYTDCVARTAEANGWSWAYWQFDSDFVLYDVVQEKWVEPILHALVPPAYAGQPFVDDFHKSGPPNIPGLVQCALYDLGGEGVAYHDTDPINNGSGKLNLETGHQRAHASPYIWQFRRDEGVDLSFVKDWADLNHTNLVTPPINQLYIGWTDEGEWCNYSVNVAAPGTYRIKCLYSYQTNTISFDLDGKPAATGQLPVSTPSFHHWNLADIGTIAFPKAGRQRLTFHYGKGNNFAYFEFEPLEAAPQRPP
jgi:endoglucanase